MRLAIKGFKSVSQIDDFCFAPLTMLAGVNSSGKTSLIQAMLLLKQTLDGDSTKPLQLQGPYLSADSFSDLVFKKNVKGSIVFVLKWTSDEINNRTDFDEYSPLPEQQPLTDLRLAVSFTADGNNDVRVKEFRCLLSYGDSGSESFSVKKRNDIYDVSYSSPAFFGGNYSLPLMRRKLEGCKVTFSNFIPLYVETSIKDGNRVYSIPMMKDLLSTLRGSFARITYLGPNRVEPVLAKSYDRLSFENVGVHGENTRFLLNQWKYKVIDDYGENLKEAVTRWVCQELGMARSFDVVRDSNMLYRTIVVNTSGSKVDLIHMGYGLSQVLPIIVQGLLTPVGGAFIVVDPEVHLHPEIQGKLVDFFIELINHGRSVIVETHSDHLITRLRRRIAEGQVLPERTVNLCYVENVEGESQYVSYGIDGQGSFTSSLPKGFLDTQDEDFRAIFFAKLNKK